MFQISNDDILRLPSPQRELSDDVLHMPIALCARQVITIQVYVTHE